MLNFVITIDLEMRAFGGKVFSYPGNTGKIKNNLRQRFTFPSKNYVYKVLAASCHKEL